MRLTTKAQLSRATLMLLCLVAFAFILGVAVLTLCAGLNINPFRESTTSILFAGFFGLIGASLGLFLLNVAINISLIADAKIAELPSSISQASLPRKWIVYLAGTAIGITAILIGSSYYSKTQYMELVRVQAEEILQDNNALLEKIAAKLQAGSEKKHYAEIYETIRFLQNQRDSLPNITLIYTGTFSGKPAYYQLAGSRGFSDSEAKQDENYIHQYYSCDQEKDCDYIKNFFAGGKAEPLQHFSFRSDEFAIYLPYIINEKRFILSFARWNRYGKFGS